MSHYLVREIEATPNVEVRAGTRSSAAAATAGSSSSCCATRRPATRRRSRPRRCSCMIGARPHTEWLPPRSRATHGVRAHRRDVADDCGWPLERRPFPLETSMPGRVRRGRRAARLGEAGGVGASARARSRSSSSTSSLRRRPPTPAPAGLSPNRPPACQPPVDKKVSLLFHPRLEPGNQLPTSVLTGISSARNHNLPSQLGAARPVTPVLKRP